MNHRHIQILVEDESGKILLDEIMKKYIQGKDNLTYKISSFKGIGRIPKKLNKKTEVKTGTLLNSLPGYLRGIDAMYKSYPAKTSVFVVLDNDDENCIDLKAKLKNLYVELGITVEVNFCIAIEEMEAWLLGDKEAVIKAYPNAKKNILQKYKQDSIVGTWECLADAVFPGGVSNLKKIANTYYEIGKFKCDCAQGIGQYLNLEVNQSPSFMFFIKKLNKFCES